MRQLYFKMMQDAILMSVKHKQTIFLAVYIFFIAAFIPTGYAEDRLNNKFGIHSATLSHEEIAQAAALNNSNGGRYSYIVLVKQDTDNDENKWQSVFDTLRKNALIPIVRLATHADGDSWILPNKDQISSDVRFLSKLNWVTKKRHIILFNEPNHGAEWGGKCDGASYGEIALAYAKALKEARPDFFIMLAGFDQSAPHIPPRYCDEAIFLRDMFQSAPELANMIDGIASHSYPNPGFSGSWKSKGRGTIRGYEWEESYFKQFVDKNLPIFITETGWTNEIGHTEVAENMKRAYEEVWLPDERVKAVAPFILRYIGEPFERFSWTNEKGEPHEVFTTIQSMPKVKGNPDIVHDIRAFQTMPHILVEDSSYQLQFIIYNMGQSIIHKPDGYEIGLVGESVFTPSFSPLYSVEPFSSAIVTMFINTKKSTLLSRLSLNIMKDKQPVAKLFDWQFSVVPAPTITLSARTFPGFGTKGPVHVDVVDGNNRKVYEEDIVFMDGKGTISRLVNVALKGRYTLRAHKINFLRKEVDFVATDGAEIDLGMFFPGDFNNDGKINLQDIL